VACGGGTKVGWEDGRGGRSWGIWEGGGGWNKKVGGEGGWVGRGGGLEVGGGRERGGWGKVSIEPCFVVQRTVKSQEEESPAGEEKETRSCTRKA